MASDDNLMVTSSTDHINSIQEKDKDIPDKITNDQREVWPNLCAFYKQIFSEETTDSGKLVFQCLQCKPKVCKISASICSNSNLRTHIKVKNCDNFKCSR